MIDIRDKNGKLLCSVDVERDFVKNWESTPGGPKARIVTRKNGFFVALFLAGMVVSQLALDPFIDDARQARKEYQQACTIAEQLVDLPGQPWVRRVPQLPKVIHGPDSIHYHDVYYRNVRCLLSNDPYLLHYYVYAGNLDASISRYIPMRERTKFGQGIALIRGREPIDCGYWTVYRHNEYALKKSLDTLMESEGSWAKPFRLTADELNEFNDLEKWIELARDDNFVFTYQRAHIGDKTKLQPKKNIPTQ